MSNTDTQVPDSYLVVSYGNSMEAIHETALQEYHIRMTVGLSVDSLLFHYARVSVDLKKKRNEAYQDIEASDYRVEHIWQKLWDALERRFDRDEVWDLILEEIDGVPDLRIKTFEVEIPLETITIEVKANDEDEAIELAIEQAEREYSLEDVIYQPRIGVSEV